jgi:ATP-dependent DNA helicase RecG
MFEELKIGAFKDIRMGLLHGQLDNKEKNRVMNEFKNRQLDVLVATTVIEVGIDVPNATVMLIENAERFGLAQLHQLRGRIGRGVHKSYCILQGDPKGLDAWKRLQIMEETRDGFRIAEEDLQIRGMGNLLGKEQSGFPTFKFGDPIADADILIAARREAFSVVEKDPDANDPNNQRLYRRAEVAFERLAAYAQVG